MIRPICRIAAVACLVWLGLAGGARADHVEVIFPDVEYPLLDEPRHDNFDDEPYEILIGEPVTFLSLPDEALELDDLIYSTQDTVPTMNEDGKLTWMANGVLYQCTCTPVPPNPNNPSTPTTPTPAEHVPEPSSLLLLGLGTLGAAIARKRLKQD